MPAARKLLQSKKAGTSKTKGTVRVKSGCYTCRIRCKKCDENPNERGHCRTCERLKLECLGFGVKPPDWLSSRSVVDLREKIKSFLASQWMIEGPSGSGPRNADQDQPFLRLTENPYHSSSSESPQSQPLSPDRDDLREQRKGAFYPLVLNEFPLLPSTRSDPVPEYVRDLINIQFPLGDQNALPNMTWEAVKKHAVTRGALTLLVRVYRCRQRQPQQIALTDSTNKMLLAHLQGELRKDNFDADDAIAALRVVSIYLFDGGKGPWDGFLALALRYVGNILRLSRYRGPRDALLDCNAKDAFIIKTVLWYDVLASVTLQRPPTTLSVIDEMFNPMRSGIRVEETINQQYSMISPMGCENNVVWALAKTSALSCWKRDQIRGGTLSAPGLYKKAMEINSHLERDPNQPSPPPLNPMDGRETSRTFAAEIFRTSTRLFLLTIVNGEYPHVKDVRRGVEDTFNSIKALGLNSTVYPSIVRSTVFGLYMCGALTENLEHRATLFTYLRTTSTSESVGNCTAILQLLEEIWNSRNPQDRSPVNWIGPLAKEDMLLV